MHAASSRLTSPKIAKGPATPFRQPISMEVFGQCEHCHDIFSVHVVRIRDGLVASETARLKWSMERNVLIHRPSICNGEVKLYGTTQHLFPPDRAGE